MRRLKSRASAAAGLVAATAAARAAGMLGGAVIAGGLGPAGMGLWSTFRGAVSYGNINHLGVLEAYRSRFAQALGRGDENEAREIEGTAYAFARASSLLFACLAFAALAVWAFVFPHSMVAQEPLAALVLALTCVPVTLGTFWSEALGVRAEFGRLSRLRLVRGIAYAVALPLGAMLSGVSGTAWALLACELLLTELTRRVALQRGARPELRLDRSRARALVACGLPITLGWWSVALFESLDRIVCAATLGAEATGFLALGALLASLVFLVPEALSRVLGRDWNLAAGRLGREAVEARCARTASRLAWIAAPLAAALSLAVPLVLPRVLPAYAAGAEAIAILLAGSSLLVLVPTGIDRLVATGRSVRLLWLAPLAVVLRVLLASVGASLDGLNGLAWAAPLSAAAFVALLWSDREGRASLPALLAPAALALALREFALTLPSSLGGASTGALLIVLPFAALAVIVPRARAAAAARDGNSNGLPGPLNVATDGRKGLELEGIPGECP
ncbi:MAG: oligosaccharide flippase family protein [Planctomycetota bacterium]|nr:oligosaccharide flippase family protein [Planctomycetota bacterium]